MKRWREIAANSGQDYMASRVTAPKPGSLIQLRAAGKLNLFLALK
jgi:hypothetical protein